MQTGADSAGRIEGQQEQIHNPRHRRTLIALLDSPRTREDIDRITGASNGPDEILRIRRQFSLKIPCKRKGTKDMDGRHVEFGTYRLTDDDRANALRLLGDEPDAPNTLLPSRSPTPLTPMGAAA